MPGNKQIIFASRPGGGKGGWVTEDNFRLVESPLPSPAVRTIRPISGGSPNFWANSLRRWRSSSFSILRDTPRWVCWGRSTKRRPGREM